ncbi:biopolymer transport protein ExbB [Candidatus Magnetomoraceae bacterium gMMP-15]
MIKEKILIIFLLMLITCMFVFDIYAESWNNVVKQVNKDIQETSQAINKTEENIKQKSKELKKKSADLKKEVAEDKKALDILKSNFDELLKKEEKLSDEIKAEQDQLHSLEEILRTVARDTDEMLCSGLAGVENPSQFSMLEPMMKADRFPGMTDIQNLGDVLFQEMEAGKKIHRYTGTYVNERGGLSSGEIVRVGNFTAIYKQGEKTGYLRIDPNLKKLVAVPGNPPWMIKRAIEKYFALKSEELPVDISGGVIVEQINKSGNIHEWLESGGLLVWPILLIAVVAIFLALERLWSLGRIPTNTDKIINLMREFAKPGNWKACFDLCRKKSKIPTCKVLEAGLKQKGKNSELIENAIEEAILKELPRLERFLPTLSVLAAIAPLLGLLGTVTGMIHTFQGITIFGTSDPRMMSGGISEALITTQLGLAVAVPIMIAHHYFDRRVEKIIGDMEEKGTSLITIIAK